VQNCIIELEFMNKKLVIEKVLAQLADDLETLYNAARASHAEATHESSKAENKYDTRGLEAGYLAQGQMRQADETEQTIEEIQKISIESLKPDSPILVGALVWLESKGEKKYFFIAPRGGGVIVEMKGQEIVVLTPQAPLGQLLIGKKKGDLFKFKQGSLAVEYRILSVV
jgi:transcription elongation GreA/GreB family factor